MIAVSRPLSTGDHDRGLAGLTYVYPVVSRRAGGVSLGINLNPNNACNWRCAYCQVPDLIRGKAPPIDLALLEAELRRALHDMLQDEWMARHVPEGMRTLRDIAFSGNGEPTTAIEFADAVERVLRVKQDFGLGRDTPVRLITNGSQFDRPAVQKGIAMLGDAGGEVWFKLDAGDREGLRRINGTRTTPEAIVRRLVRCTDLCRTWVQTCVFHQKGVPQAEENLAAYLTLLETIEVKKLVGVQLYSLARPSRQSNARDLSPFSEKEIAALASRIEAHGLKVLIAP